MLSRPMRDRNKARKLVSGSAISVATNCDSHFSFAATSAANHYAAYLFLVLLKSFQLLGIQSSFLVSSRGIFGKFKCSRNDLQLNVPRYSTEHGVERVAFPTADFAPERIQIERVTAALTCKLRYLMYNNVLLFVCMNGPP